MTAASFPKEWLTRLLLPAEGQKCSREERLKLLSEIKAQNCSQNHRSDHFWACLEGQDELWEYDTPVEYWESLAGESGLVIIRGGFRVQVLPIEWN